VQWVNRPSHDFRGFSGFIAGGNVKPGDIVRILPSGRDTTIARIVTYDGDLAHAVAGQSVTLTLTEEIDISRGDMLASPVSPAKIGDRLSARLLWLVREPLTLDKSYLLKLGARTTPAFVKQVASHIQIETGLAEPLADSSQTLAFNEIGEAELWLDTAIACDLYEDNRETGGFILIDRVTNETVAVGMVKQSAWTERSARNGVEASYASMEGVPSPDQLLHPTPLRSLVKSLSWRVPGSVITFGAAFLFTQDTGISAAITGTEIVSKIVLYYLHERLWTRFAVGLTKGEPPHDDTGL
jgi:sulfate adenylyltransferase subunit 1 (EFTu-like GTPase family)/uncharacterized membrane protein